jgi:hypothetical protein
MRDPAKVRAARQRYEARHPERKRRLAAYRPSRVSVSSRTETHRDRIGTETARHTETRVRNPPTVSPPYRDEYREWGEKFAALGAAQRLPKEGYSPKPKKEPEDEAPEFSAPPAPKKEPPAIDAEEVPVIDAEEVSVIDAEYV